MSELPLPGDQVLATLDQLATVVQSVVANGPSAGCRAIDLRVYGGIDVRVLPDRGCDLGAAWFRGIPVAWISAVEERAPFEPASGEEWLEAFGGGLMTTCGLRNVGWASEGVGLHGAFSHQRARLVTVDRFREEDDVVALVHARIKDASHSRWYLELERTITTKARVGRVSIVDITRNKGGTPEPAPILYHVNVGAPLWDTDAVLELPHSQEVLPWDEAAASALRGWSRPPAPQVGPDRCFEHRINPGPDGWAAARVSNPRLDLSLTLRWDATTLPRFNQWVQPTPGVYALGLEPMNCSAQGREADRTQGSLPILAPGEERITRLDILAGTSGPGWS